MQNTAITVENLSVHFNKRGSLAKGLKSKRFSAFSNISFKIYEGESLGILGRNGAGKSTLLKCLNGILLPDEGTITNHANLSVSLLSISAGFVGNLSGKENAILSGLLLGISKPKIMEKINEIKALADIGAFFDEPVKTYSSGMKSRLGFSVAYYLDSDIILIDEVISVGDASFRKKSADLMKARIKDNKTAVIVTHNTVLAEQLCDRLLYLTKGGDILSGSKHEIIGFYEKNT